MKHLLFILLFAISPIFAFAQSGGITGRVVSRDGRQPIAGVTVSTDPRTMTATTDKNGVFTLKGMADQTYMLDLKAPG